MTRHLAIAAGLFVALTSPALAGVHPGGPIVGPIPANTGSVASPRIYIAAPIFPTPVWRLPKVSAETFTQTGNLIGSHPFSAFCTRNAAASSVAATTCLIPKSGPVGTPVFPCFGCPRRAVVIPSTNLVGGRSPFVIPGSTNNGSIGTPVFPCFGCPRRAVVITSTNLVGDRSVFIDAPQSAAYHPVAISRPWDPKTFSPCTQSSNLVHYIEPAVRLRQPAVWLRHRAPPQPLSRQSGHSFGLSLQLGNSPEVFGTIHQ
jgi:hypothetical protein